MEPAHQVEELLANERRLDERIGKLSKRLELLVETQASVARLIDIYGYGEVLTDANLAYSQVPGK